MDQQVQHPLATRGRILLFALLAAFAWLLLGIFTGGTAAVADDSADTDDGILGTLTATVEGVVPVTVVTDTLNEVAEPLAPVIDTTVKLVNDLVEDSTDALIGIEIADPPTSVEALPPAATAYEPGPAAVKVTAVTPDTRVASVPAAGSLSSPQAPVAPTDPVVPTPAPTPSLGQTSGAPALLAAFAHVGGPLTLAVASAASTTFALPTSPTFDNDSSPD